MHYKYSKWAILHFSHTKVQIFLCNQLPSLKSKLRNQELYKIHIIRLINQFMTILYYQIQIIHYYKNSQKKKKAFWLLYNIKLLNLQNNKKNFQIFSRKLSITKTSMTLHNYATRCKLILKALKTNFWTTRRSWLVLVNKCRTISSLLIKKWWRFKQIFYK